jgi:signal peptidase I
MRLGILVVVLIGLLVILWACPLRLAMVAGRSMTPALKSGQLVLIDKGFYHSHPVAPGDVVALTVDHQLIVKRVRRVNSLASLAPRPRGGSQGLVFVTGDAADISWDSRSFGPVPEKTIVGRVIGWFGPEPPQPPEPPYLARARQGDG